MRILFLTNYYPPCARGWGYMQLCEEVADSLVSRGHNIFVLTSTQRDGPELDRPYPVRRLLAIDPKWHSRRPAAWQFFAGRRQRERKAVDYLHRAVSDYRPELIFIWNTNGLTRVLLQAAEQLPDCVTVYYLAGYLPELPDEYISYWQASAVRPSAKLLKRPLARLALAILAQEGRPVQLQYKHAICVSDYVRQRLVTQGLIPATSIVIHNGVNLQDFQPRAGPRDFSKGMSLLYAGRLEPDKGVHTILEALALLSKEQCEQVRGLTIVGDGDTNYRFRLSQMAEELSLSDMIHFRDPVVRTQMPALLDKFDVFVLPSSLEALSRMMQEAMAMGLLVVGTTTGGSSELLIHERTGLVFEAGNPKSLASQLTRVASEPGLADQLAQAGEQAVRECFDIRRTVDRIEAYLQKAIDQRASP